MRKKEVTGEKLSLSQYIMMGVGGIIGAGFFLASGIAIRFSGPAVILNYGLSAFVMWRVLYALAEMAGENPAAGSFRVYNQVYLGKAAGFMSGWIYWTAGVLVMSSEVTACGIFTKYWFPDAPLWVFTLIYSIMVVYINFKGVKEFGTIEAWFSFIKVGALFAMVLIGLWVILTRFRSTDIGIQNLYIHGGFFAGGIKGFVFAMLMSLIPFGGIEVAAMAAGSVENPHENVPKGIRGLFFILIGLYMASIVILLILTPWNRIPVNVSPFVSMFRYVRAAYIDSVLNFVVLTAALTTMNAAMFSVTQVLFSLGQGEWAPEFFTIKNSRGIPIYALGASSIGLALAVVLSYLLPGDVYEYITSAAGFMLFFNWEIILLAFMAFLKKRRRGFSKIGVSKMSPETAAIYPDSIPAPLSRKRIEHEEKAAVRLVALNQELTTKVAFILLSIILVSPVMIPKQRFSVLIAFGIILFLAMAYIIGERLHIFRQ
ncbi:MAG: aromatic amino acid transport protein AroP [Tepidanaerobacteraceae bacterium]|nr:aromatic amino acid transport protein AroP [Tepidanaerobacteraceae bacterium]